MAHFIGLNIKCLKVLDTFLIHVRAIMKRAYIGAGCFCVNVWSCQTLKEKNHSTLICFVQLLIYRRICVGVHLWWECVCVRVCVCVSFYFGLFNRFWCVFFRVLFTCILNRIWTARFNFYCMWVVRIVNYVVTSGK